VIATRGVVDRLDRRRRLAVRNRRRYLSAPLRSATIVAVRFAYEWHDDSGNWFRSYGNENWEFDENGLMVRRFACINDLPIKESERKYIGRLGGVRTTIRGLSELGL
jgi:nuclear transport factor 2 (NTF2) superfamily protein